MKIKNTLLKIKKNTLLKIKNTLLKIKPPEMEVASQHRATIPNKIIDFLEN